MKILAAAEHIGDILKLASFKRIFKTNFKPEFQDLVETLASSLNDGIDGLYDALNGKLTLSDNLYCNVTDITVKVDSTGTPTTPTSFPVSLKTKVIGIQVIDARNQSDSTTFPTSGVFVSFSAGNNKVNINNVTGLQPNTPYNLKIITWG